MQTASHQDIISIDLDWCTKVDCSPQIGRISGVDLVFKGTDKPYPLPALHIIVTVQVDGEEVVYEQALGTQYPHGDHSSEHTHNQITGLMQLCRASSWNDITGQPVIVLRGRDDPAAIYGLSDIERSLFCHRQKGGLVLVWDE